MFLSSAAVLGHAPLNTTAYVHNSSSFLILQKETQFSNWAIFSVKMLGKIIVVI